MADPSTLVPAYLRDDITATLARTIRFSPEVTNIDALAARMKAHYETHS